MGQRVYLGPCGLVFALDGVKLVLLVGDGLHVVLHVLAEVPDLRVQLFDPLLVGMDLGLLNLELLRVELFLVDEFLLALLVVDAELRVFLH